MSEKPFLLGIDQGTSGSRALVLDQAGQVRGFGYQSLVRQYPRTGWVEQEPATVSAGVAAAITAALEEAGLIPEGREAIYHVENGLLGMGPDPEPDRFFLDLVEKVEGCEPEGVAATADLSEQVTDREHCRNQQCDQPPRRQKCEAVHQRDPAAASSRLRRTATNRTKSRTQSRSVRSVR